MQSLLIVLAVGLYSLVLNLPESRSTSHLPAYVPTQDSIKIKAFQVLTAKCNSCHLDKKPTYVFTLDNMNTYANTINKQVFIKEKMPKGKDFPLTPEDRFRLQNWLKTQLPELDFD